MHRSSECLAPKAIHGRSIFANSSHIRTPLLLLLIGRKITVVLQTVLLDDASQFQGDVTLCELVAQQQPSSIQAVAFFDLFNNGQLVAWPTGVCYQAICTPENVGQSRMTTHRRC